MQNTLVRDGGGDGQLGKKLKLGVSGEKKLKGGKKKGGKLH